MWCVCALTKPGITTLSRASTMSVSPDSFSGENMTGMGSTLSDELPPYPDQPVRHNLFGLGVENGPGQNDFLIAHGRHSHCLSRKTVWCTPHGRV